MATETLARESNSSPASHDANAGGASGRRYGRPRYGGTVLSSTRWLADNAPVLEVDYARVIQRLVDAGARS